MAELGAIAGTPAAAQLLAGRAVGDHAAVAPRAPGDRGGGQAPARRCSASASR